MKIAIYQGQGRPKRVVENLKIIRSAALSAAKQGARLIIFPEMFLTGYNIGDAVFDLAEPPDDPGLKKWLQSHRRQTLLCSMVILRNQTQAFIIQPFLRKENPVLTDCRPELYAAPVKGVSV